MTRLKSTVEARGQLERLFQYYDPRSDNVPKRLDPALVETFIRDMLAKQRPQALAARLSVMIADFYALRPLTGDFINWLDHTERDEDHFLGSLALTRGVGLLGDDAQWQTGLGYFEHLLRLPYAERRMRELLACHGVYAVKKSSPVTGLRLDEIITGLKAREATDRSAAMARRSMADLRSTTLSRIEAAAAMQRDILALAPDERRRRLVDLYLGLDLSYYEQVNRWVVRVIQQEARSAGTDAVVTALRAALPQLDQGKHDSQPVAAEAVAARRRRLFAAIEFFEGALSQSELGELQPAEKRLELLSNEP